MSGTKLPEIDGALPPETEQQLDPDDPQRQQNRTGGEFSSNRNSQSQPAPGGGGKSAFVAKKERQE